jgi:hypothetical protein
LGARLKAAQHALPRQNFIAEVVMDSTRRIGIFVAILCSGPALAADPAAPAAAPAPSTVAEAPYVGEPMELTAEQRQELAFRAVQKGLDTPRSDKAEDAEVIVCKKEKPTGSNTSVVNCATNRYWMKIRSSSMAAGIGGGAQTAGGTGAYGGGGGGSAKKEDKVITLSMSDYYKMEKRFGKAPKEAPTKP